MNIKMIDLFYIPQPDKCPKLNRRQRVFLIYCKAFCLGLIDTPATLREMMTVCDNISDHIVDGLVEKIVEVEYA